jgi:hypothetical protein
MRRLTAAAATRAARLALQQLTAHCCGPLRAAVLSTPVPRRRCKQRRISIALLLQPVQRQHQALGSHSYSSAVNTHCTTLLGQACSSMQRMLRGLSGELPRDLARQDGLIAMCNACATELTRQQRWRHVLACCGGCCCHCRGN